MKLGQSHLQQRLTNANIGHILHACSEVIQTVAVSQAKLAVQ